MNMPVVLPLKRRIMVLGILSVLLFSVYNILNWIGPGVNSPDEMVNRVFAGVMADRTSLRLPVAETYSTVRDFIHPRSTYVISSGYIVPVSFWGLPALYGALGKVVGVSGAALATSLLAICMMWALYALWLRVFGEKIAWIAALLFAIHPAVWYYTARSFFPNIPSLALAVIGGTILALQPFRSRVARRWLVNDWAGVGLLGLSALIRPVEAVWWIGVAVILVALYRNDIDYRRYAVWLAGALITMLVFLAVNARVYMDAVGTYVASNSLPVTGWYSYLLPFGIRPRALVMNSYAYGLMMMWWLMIPAMIGFGYSVIQLARQSMNRPRAERAYALVTVWVGLWLLAYYGSAPDFSRVHGTIGMSYIRYWLPVFILLIPYVAIFFAGLLDRLVGWKRMSAQAGFAFVVSALSLRLIWAGIDGLWAVKNYEIQNETLRAQIVSITPSSAVILTDTEDKSIWPDRAVMVKAFHPDILGAARHLLDQGVPVYYLSTTIHDMSLVQRELQPYGLLLESSVIEQSPHSLYPLSIR